MSKALQYNRAVLTAFLSGIERVGTDGVLKRATVHTRLSARLVKITLLPLFVVACSSGSASSTGPTDSPDFALSVSPASLTLEPGATEELAISITRSGGFTGAVSVSVEGLPVGVTAAPATIAGDAGSGVLALVAAPAATAGQAQVTLRATTTVAGVVARSATTTVTVTATNALDLDLDLDYTALNAAERTLLTGLDDAERAALSLWRTQVLAEGKNNGGLYFNVLNNPQNFAEAEVDVVRDLYNEEMATFGEVNGKVLDELFFAVTQKVAGLDIASLYESAPREVASGPVKLDNLLSGDNGLGRFNNAVIRLWTNDLLDNGEMDGSITKFTLLSPFALDKIGGSLDLEDVKPLLAADLVSGTPDGAPLRLAFSDVLDAIYFGLEASSGSSIAGVLNAAGINQPAADALFAEWAARRGYNP